MAEEMLDLFASPPPPRIIGELDLSEYRNRISRLADHGLFIGTSSWKYDGWLGMIYDEKRYTGKRGFSKSRFEQECLSEYADTFRTVCFDGGYYQFPSREFLRGMLSQVSGGFQFAMKVTEEITVKRFANIPRNQSRVGMVNPNFLNLEMFNRLFLEPLSEFKDKVGPLIFEFSTFDKGDFEHGRDFITALDLFLGQLPKGWKFGVEIRNKGWLQPEYFAMLHAHNVAHVYNNWTRMPPISEQRTIANSLTADFAVCRFLLKPGRSYKAAVDQFSPYKERKDRVADAIDAACKLLEASFELKRAIYLYFNNRLEGSAPITIAEILQVLQIFAALPQLRGN